MKALSLFSLPVFLIIAACETTSPEVQPIREAYKHIRASWSPDGRSVAFTGDVNGVFGIYAVDTSGANLRLVHEGDALGLTWSPDGQFIAYSEGSLIYAVSVAQDVPRLVVPQASSIRPAWSPDGSMIAYVRNGIRTVEISTGRDTEVYPTGTSPSWRPDGRNILISYPHSDASTIGISYDVFQVSVDSPHRSDVFTLLSVDDCAFFTLTPDGRDLLFSRKPEGDYAQVRRITVPTRTETGLTTDGGDYPAISPNGEWVVYTRTTEGYGGLWLMRIDGSEKRQLTSP